MCIDIGPARSATVCIEKVQLFYLTIDFDSDSRASLDVCTISRATDGRTLAEATGGENRGNQSETEQLHVDGRERDLTVGWKGHKDRSLLYV
jgi:hypothetical protein